MQLEIETLNAISPIIYTWSNGQNTDQITVSPEFMI